MSRRDWAVAILILGVITCLAAGCSGNKREMITVKVKDQDEEGVRFAMVRLEGQEEGKSWVVIDSALTDQRGLAIFSPSKGYRSYQVTVSKYGLAFNQFPVLPNTPAEVVGRVEIPPSSLPASEETASSELGKPAEEGAATSLTKRPAGKSEPAKKSPSAKQKPSTKKPTSVPSSPARPPGFADMSALDQIRWYSSVNDPVGVLSTKTKDLQGERRGEALFYRAMAYASLDNSDSALVTYQMAAQASPRLRSQVLLNVGVIHMKRSRLDDAMNAFDEALRGQLSDEKRGLVYLNQAACRVSVAKASKQRARYLQAARQDLMAAKDLLCAGRVKGREADCKRIDDLTQTVDKLEREPGRR